MLDQPIQMGRVKISTLQRTFYIQFACSDSCDLNQCTCFTSFN